MFCFIVALRFAIFRCLCQISLRIKSKKGEKLQSYQKESTTKKKNIYIYTCICYTSWRLFSSMMYELYEADTPYEWVLEWYIRVSAYQLTFIFLRNFIFKKLRSKHLSSSSSAESFFFLPSKILKLHRIDRTYATFHPSQKKKIFDWKKNVKP